MVDEQRNDFMDTALNYQPPRFKASLRIVVLEEALSNLLEAQRSGDLEELDNAMVEAEQVLATREEGTI